MDIINVLTTEFMLRAIAAGILIAILTSIIGVFITLKQKAYLSDGIAHASLAGIAFALLLSFQPIIFATLVAIIMAVGITYFEKRVKINFDALIGIFYSVFFALGIIIINLSESYQPELISYLFGSLLFVTWVEVVLALAVTLFTIMVVTIAYEKIVYATFDRQAAHVRGVRVHLIDYFINILAAVSIIIAVRIVGVVLVAGMLIIPASTARLVSKSFGDMIPLAIVFNIFNVLAGIVISYYLKVPPGATIVVLGGACFFFVASVSRLIQRKPLLT